MEIPYIPGKQTVEFRAPDGSADIYHLLAGIACAVREGLQDSNALENTQKLYVNVNIFTEDNKHILNRLQHLPQSCWESAASLEKHRAVFEKNNVFPSGTIDRFIRQLQQYNDKGLSERLFGQEEEIYKLVERYVHSG